MKNIKGLKIIGIDSARPPRIRKEPYIDLVFKLSDRALKEWCDDFNTLFIGANYSVKVDTVDCLYIETWVKTMEEIPDHFAMLKTKVAECTQAFLAREAARTQALLNAGSEQEEDQGAQGQLNDIISQLNYD